MSRIKFLYRIFSQLCFCMRDFTKIVRLLLAAVSINGLTHSGLRVPLEIVVWIDDIFENNIGIKNDFTKYLKESC